jgi:PAS domain S-box-containing protein
VAEILGSKNFGEKIPGHDPDRPPLIHLLDASEEDLKKYYPGARRDGTMITAPIDGKFFGMVHGKACNRKASAFMDSAGRRLGAYEMFCYVPVEKKLIAASPVENFFHPGLYVNKQGDPQEKKSETPDSASRQVMHFPNLFNALKTTESGIVILDLSAHCVWANDAFISLFGTGNGESIIGKSVAPFIPGEQRKPVLDHLSNVRKHWDHAVLPLSLLTSKGRVPVEASISLVADDKGTALGYLAIIRIADEHRKSGHTHDGGDALLRKARKVRLSNWISEFSKPNTNENS